MMPPLPTVAVISIPGKPGLYCLWIPLASKSKSEKAEFNILSI